MKYSKIKKYAIHILAVPALAKSVFDLPTNQCALIVLTRRSNEFIESTSMKKIIVDIEDVEYKWARGAITGAHARMIITFINNLPAEVTDLYVCCSKGCSRSPGCAAALLLMSGRSDKDVWLNPFYYPNTLVFGMICREFGIFMPWINVYLRRHINRIAYSLISKKHGKTKYERWQILN